MYVYVAVAIEAQAFRRPQRLQGSNMADPSEDKELEGEHKQRAYEANPGAVPRDKSELTPKGPVPRTYDSDFNPVDAAEAKAEAEAEAKDDPGK